MKTRIPLILSVLLLATCAVTAQAQDDVAVDSDRLCPQVQRWLFRPGTADQIRWQTVEENEASILELEPGGRLLGVESERLVLGEQLAGDHPWRVTAQIRNDGLQQGVFAFSMYCYDQAGKSLKQLVFCGLNERSPKVSWRRTIASFGPGTSLPFPEGTHAVALRFSFYEASGNCQGKVSIRQVGLEPLRVSGQPHWPAEILADVGDLQVRLESRSFWTLYRIDHRGVRICVDRFGSHYGSVVRFPEIGFIGSGHTENEDERIEQLALMVDGRPVENPAEKLRCESLELLKTSRIRSLRLMTRILVTQGKIYESVRLVADEATPVSLIYHFMHPWVPSARDYLAETWEGQEISGRFDGDRGQKIDQPTRWSALHDPETNTGAVTCVLEAPAEAGHWRTRYWDIDKVYRKHYFTTFLNQTIPAHREYSYGIVTIPFFANSDEWQDVAKQIAAANQRPADVPRP